MAKGPLCEHEQPAHVKAPRVKPQLRVPSAKGGRPSECESLEKCSQSLAFAAGNVRKASLSSGPLQPGRGRGAGLARQSGTRGLRELASLSMAPPWDTRFLRLYSRRIWARTRQRRDARATKSPIRVQNLRCGMCGVPMCDFSRLAYGRGSGEGRKCNFRSLVYVRGRALRECEPLKRSAPDRARSAAMGNCPPHLAFPSWLRGRLLRGVPRCAGRLCRGGTQGADSCTFAPRRCL